MRIAPIAINICLIALEVVACFFMPIFAYWNVSVANVDTDFWTQRYLIILIYNILE